MLRNKVAVITGGSRGIGFSMAKAFSETHGAIAVVCSRDIKRAKMATNQINGNCVPEQVDVSNEVGVKDFVTRIMKRYGKIDILINNAGFYFDKDVWHKRFHQITREELTKILAVDLWGSFYMSREVIKAYLAGLAAERPEITGPQNKCKRGSVIINISSTPALEGYVKGSPYTIAKSSILGLTKCIAKEYAENNIRCYTLALGNIATIATFGKMNDYEIQKASNESPMKRWGTPEEVAEIAACIASDNFSYATGNTIIVDGGTAII